MSIKNLLLSLTIATTIMQPAIAKQEIAKPMTKKEMAIKSAKIAGHLSVFGSSVAIGSIVRDLYRSSDWLMASLSPAAINGLISSTKGLYKEVVKPLASKLFGEAKKA